jgi:hypothetical protein
MNDPARLSDILGAAAKSLGVEDPKAVSALWRRWTEVVGESIAAHAEPSSLRDGVLRVRADSPVWATEITYLAEEIRTAIDRELGPGSVRSVSVWTGPAKQPKRSSGGAREVSGSSDPQAPENLAEVSPEDALERARNAWKKGRSRGSSQGPRNQENRR